VARFVKMIVPRRAFVALATLALAVQIAAVAAVPWRALDVPAGNELIAEYICHAADSASTGHGAPAHHDPGDCALCPFCRVLGHAPVLPAPPTLVAVAVMPKCAPAVTPPGARAPPSRPEAFAFPRGPPIPV